MPYPRFRRARAHKHVTLTTGDVVITATSFTTVSATLELTLEAVIGDTIEVGLSAVASHNTTGGLIAFDVATIVSNAVVSRVGAAGDGVAAWREQRAAVSEFSSIAGSIMYNVTSSDLALGTVTLRLLARTNTGQITLYADGANRRAQLWAKNLGPPDAV